MRAGICGRAPQDADAEDSALSLLELVAIIVASSVCGCIVCGMGILGDWLIIPLKRRQCRIGQTVGFQYHWLLSSLKVSEAGHLSLNFVLARCHCDADQ